MARVDDAHPHKSNRTDHPAPTCGSPCMMGVGHPGQNDGRVDATAHTRPMYRADARLFHIRGTGPQPIAVKQFGFNDNPRRPGSSTSSSSRTVGSHATVPHPSRQHCRMRPWCPHALACHPHFSHVRHPIVRIEHITGVSSVSSCTRLHAYAHRAQSGPLHVRFTQSGHPCLRHQSHPHTPTFKDPTRSGRRHAQTRHTHRADSQARMHSTHISTHTRTRTQTNTFF